MVSLKDVAKVACVSTATVSRVITGRNKVDESTKKKVLAAIKELNYQPNFLGKQLRELHTNNILVIIPDFSNSYFYEVLQGIEIMALENEYEILLKNMKNHEKEDLDYFKYLHQKQVSGIIMLTVGEEEKLINLSNDRLVIACAYLEKTEIPSVHVDSIKSAYEMTKHLIDLGHRSIAFISGGMETISSRDRFKGYKTALLESGIELNSDFIQEGDYSFQSGIHVTNRLLDLRRPPTAIFATSDTMAAGSIKGIKRRGLSVPNDIAVVGFDNIELASIVEPELTTISQPSFEIGKIAMEMMHNLILGKKLSNTKIVLEGELIVRESCGFNSK